MAPYLQPPMLGLKISRTLTIAVILTALAASAGEFAFAETMSSDNYRVQNDVLSQGGDTSGSDNYAANDAIGELATGEDLASDNYLGCSGFECFDGAQFITFDVRAGLTEGTAVAGDPVELGAIDLATLATSDGATINSVFISASSSAGYGTVVTVRSENGALQSISNPLATITSANASPLAAGTAGYGVCVETTDESVDSPNTFDKQAPYNGTCNKTTGHFIGGVGTSPATILAATGYLLGGEAEILVKAAIGGGTIAAADYSDTLTFIATASY